MKCLIFETLLEYALEHFANIKDIHLHEMFWEYLANVYNKIFLGTKNIYVIPIFLEYSQNIFCKIKHIWIVLKCFKMFFAGWEVSYPILRTGHLHITYFDFSGKHNILPTYQFIGF